MVTIQLRVPEKTNNMTEQEQMEYKMIVSAMVIYWVITTIGGTYFLSKSYLRMKGYVTLGDIFGSLIMSMLISWAIWPVMMGEIKVIKKKKTE